MAAARSVPPFLPLALGTVAAGCAPLAPPPFAAALLLLAAGLGLAAPSLDRASPRRALAGLGSSLLVLAILMAPFLPALAAAKGLLAAAPEPRALLWLTALLALLLGGCWLLAPAPVLASSGVAPWRAAGAALRWHGGTLDLAAALPAGLFLLALGFAAAALAAPDAARLPLGMAALALPLPVVAWLLARRIADRGQALPAAPPPPPAAVVPKPTADPEGQLYEAARRGRVDEALALLEAGVDARALPRPGEPDQRSLMQIAVTLPDLRLLRALIARGLSVNEEHGGLTPLICALRDSRQGRLEAVMMLLANGARVDAWDRERNQPVHHAARCLDPAVIAALLDAGADPEVLNGEGLNALAVALEAQCWDTAQFLLRRGVRSEPEGGCPAMVAAVRGLEDDPTGVRLLRRFRARLEAADRLGRRALHHAALHGHLRICEALLELGADANAQDAHGATPTMEAVRGGHLRVLEQLALARPDLGLRDALGRTALMIAVASKHPDPAICRLLVAMGGDPHAPGPDGRSAIEQARALGRHPLVAALDPVLAAREGVEAGEEGAEAGEPVTDPLPLLAAALARGRLALAEPLLAMVPERERLAALALETTDPEVLRWLAARAGITARTPLPDGRLLGAALAEEPGAWRRLAVLEGGREPFLGRGRFAELILALDQAGELPAAERFLIELLAIGADAFGPGPRGIPPLLAAVAAGSLPLAETLLARGADPNAGDRCGRTPLAEVLARGCPPAWLRLLLAAGADPGRRDAAGETPLGEALESDLREALAWLHPERWRWPGRPVRGEDLIDAARLGDCRALECLSACGLPLDARDAQGATALLHAAGLGRREAVAWLLAHGADPDARAANGASCLSAAIVGRDPAVIRMLLEGGADAEQPLAGGASALFVAAAIGAADAVRLLLGFGAKVDRTEETGRSALMVAAEAAFRASLGGGGAEGYEATIAALLEGGADPRQRSPRGDTALALLLGSRVQPGRAPVEALLLPALERLLAAGADPDAQDERGVGPLHAAAIHGLARCTGRLLAAGADPERRDRLGRRPADLARLLGYPALCALFEQFRAPRPERGRSRSDRDSPLS